MTEWLASSLVAARLSAMSKANANLHRTKKAGDNVEDSQ